MNCKEECMQQKKDGTLKDCPIVKENEQLKEQIEKMKCCGNCRKSRVGNPCPYWNDSFQCKKDNYKEWKILID